MDKATFDAEENELTFGEGAKHIYGSTEDVTITYSAVVLDTAVSATPETVTNNNKAELGWGNTDPDDDDEPEDDDDEKAKVYNMGFTKVDGKDNSIKLAGAEFKLYSDAECTKAVNVTGADGVYVVDTDSISNVVVTPENGQVVVKGLAAGTYYLKETKAPEGYNLVANAFTVEVLTDKQADYTIGETTYSVNSDTSIVNNSGVELPSTGGKGTMMLITFGTMVAVAFAVLMITQKKMSIYND